MIFITCALYCEAKPFIEINKLLKDMSCRSFQLFKNEDIILIISGVGIINSSAATSFMLTKFDAGPKDIFINIGICGSKYKSIAVGSCVLCNKIVYKASDKVFYADMLYKHPFIEGSLETHSKIVCDTNLIQSDFVDMEGAAAFRSALFFLPIQNIFCIKIVSDYIDKTSIKPAYVSEIVMKNVPSIISFLKAIEENILSEGSVLNFHEQEIINLISNNLSFSIYMKNEFEKLCLGYKIRKENLNIINTYTNIEAKSKLEGKTYYEELKHKLME